MAKVEGLNAILARNLHFWMSRENALYKNANALGVAAGIAANTVRNYLEPTKRRSVTDKGEGFPTVDKLAALASKLGCEVWELLHPDIEQSIREREMYKKVEADFKRIQEQANRAAEEAAAKSKARQKVRSS